MPKLLFVVVLGISFIAAGNNSEPFSVARGITGAIINGVIVLALYGIYRLVRRATGHGPAPTPEVDTRAEWLRRNQIS